MQLPCFLHYPQARFTLEINLILHQQLLNSRILPQSVHIVCTTILQYHKNTQSRGIGDSPSADNMTRIAEFWFFPQPLGGPNPETAKLFLPAPERSYYQLLAVLRPPQWARTMSHDLVFGRNGELVQKLTFNRSQWRKFHLEQSMVGCKERSYWLLQDIR
jgi:hypothetical protein